MAKQDDYVARVDGFITSYVAEIKRRKSLPLDPELAEKPEWLRPFSVTDVNLDTIEKDLRALLKGHEVEFLDQVNAEVAMHQKINDAISAYDPTLQPHELQRNRLMNDAQYVVIRKAEQARENALMDKIFDGKTIPGLDHLLYEESKKIKPDSQKVQATEAVAAWKKAITEVSQATKQPQGLGKTVIKELGELNSVRAKLKYETSIGGGIVAYNIARDAVAFAGIEEFRAQLKMEELKIEKVVAPDRKENVADRTVAATDEDFARAMDAFVKSVVISPDSARLAMPANVPAQPTRGIGIK